MENQNFKIEYARFEDIKEINELWKQSWLATYPSEEYGISNEDILPQLELTDEKIAFYKKYFEEHPSGPGYWVVRNGHEIAGFIRVKKLENNIGQLKAVYVLPKYFGTGVAKMLMETALDYLKDCDEIFVQCVAYNDRATKFYQKYGFVLDESTKTPNYVLSTGKEMPEHTLRKLQK